MASWKHLNKDVKKKILLECDIDLFDLIKLFAIKDIYDSFTQRERENIYYAAAVFKTKRRRRLYVVEMRDKSINSIKSDRIEEGGTCLNLGYKGKYTSTLPLHIVKYSYFSFCPRCDHEIYGVFGDFYDSHEEKCHSKIDSFRKPYKCMVKHCNFKILDLVERERHYYKCKKAKWKCIMCDKKGIGVEKKAHHIKWECPDAVKLIKRDCERSDSCYYKGSWGERRKAKLARKKIRERYVKGHMEYLVWDVQGE